MKNLLYKSFNIVFSIFYLYIAIFFQIYWNSIKEDDILDDEKKYRTICLLIVWINFSITILFLTIVLSTNKSMFIPISIKIPFHLYSILLNYLNSFTFFFYAIINGIEKTFVYNKYNYLLIISILLLTKK